ncbi:cytochrome c biogenesis CcdA family protein [Candidatus Kryptobacter tengchongensis]|uniref:Cytochrome c-type biogenesis protein n=1 Tax=Kryptobacter tengchongensis TaxID=1643429 RepID=A0A916PC79_KRYT1|nr:cytochrome c biogenesis protein CcdA [Candidatus Kryptobacter tengchongensis]CUT03361.1 cytochrome c-type biogenesis protein [Candidatus Kryptobacter tengchongensis]
MESVGLFTAFLFGILSFLSPCVLPLVPGYISFVSGLSFEELRESESSKRFLIKTLLSSVFFVFGFSIVFVALGASATAVGKFLSDNMNIISKVAGVIIILFGLHMTGIFKIKFLNYEAKLKTKGKPLGLIGAFVVGFAFAFGWTPCIGPVLATILVLASQQETIKQGILLLSVYSLGLGIPFIITSLSVNFFFKWFSKVRRYLNVVEITSGIILILLGVLIFTNSLGVISAYIMKLFPFLSKFS